MTVYIIVHSEWNTIESVWETSEQAQMAINLLAIQSRIPPSYYHIVERELNSIKKREDANIRRS